MIAELDDGLGLILNTLKTRHKNSENLIIFTNDNGGARNISGSEVLNFPLRGFKGDVFEGGIRVPLAIEFMTSNKIFSRKGIVVEDTVSLLDISPTILDYAGILSKSYINKLDGKSLLPLLKSHTSHNRNSKDKIIQSQNNSRLLYWRFWMTGREAQRAIRFGDYKWLKDGNSTSMLFNITADISEKNNICASRRYMCTRLEQLHSVWEAKLPPFSRTKTVPHRFLSTYSSSSSDDESYMI